MQIISLTDEAMVVIQNQSNLCKKVGLWFGPNSSEYLKMVESRNDCLTNLFRLGGEIFADGEFDLIGKCEYIVYGMNFSAKTTLKDPEFSGIESIGTWSINS